MWRNKIRKVDDNISRWARSRCSSRSVQFSICWAEYNWRRLHSIPDWTWRHRIAGQQNLTVSHINSWWHNIGKFLKRPILPPAPSYQYTATWRNHTTHHQTPNGPPIFFKWFFLLKVWFGWPWICLTHLFLMSNSVFLFEEDDQRATFVLIWTKST